MSKGVSPPATGCSQAEPVVSALRASPPDAVDWKLADATNLEWTIAVFKDTLPGWWFSVGECQVSADASCAPTVESEHIALIPLDPRFDSGFHADLPQPATMADALRHVMEEALAAVREAKHGM